MSIDLRKVLGLSKPPHVQTEHASFYCHIPTVAPFGYLHTIFNPVDAFESASGIPEGWKAFLKVQNGAFLFQNSLYLYGLSPVGKLNSRGGNYHDAAFSLDRNQNLSRELSEDWLQVGSYGFDAARILMSRADGKLQVLPSGSDDAVSRWQCLDDFLRVELKRISMLFSASGVLLADEKYTAPVVELTN